MQDSLSLYQLNRQVAQTISQNFRAPVWVTAEIAQLSVASNGHCYMDLVEQDPVTHATLAKARATVWANRWALVRLTFEEGTGQMLTAGIKVLIEVQVTMHEAFGYSLNVLNIDPSYTLGEMQRKRQEIIRRLTEEGIIDANRTLSLPRLPQRLAIISANTAAGYGDFCHQLEHNEWSLKFYTHLFPAAMQGDQTAPSVIRALDQVYQHIELFDAVVIIRGGGAVADLNSFDDYNLAFNVANFPLPIIVGIGHERDKTVLDEVAHTSVKTPTAAAAMLIERLADELGLVMNFQETLLSLLPQRMEHERAQLDRITATVCGSHLRLNQELNTLTLLRQHLSALLSLRLDKEKQQIDFMQRTVQMAQPDNLLKRGFSITRVNGHAVKDASTLHPGDVLETQTAKGKVRSVVK